MSFSSESEKKMLQKIVPELLKKAGWSRFGFFLWINIVATVLGTLAFQNSGYPLDLSDPIQLLIMVISALTCYLFIWIFIKKNIPE